MGIINMMIVIPMLIQSFSFGWIYQHLLDSNANNAITATGALLACAALAMAWIKEPPITPDIEAAVAAPGKH
jgi:maltose/moltooligosaccharide transporter